MSLDFPMAEAPRAAEAVTVAEGVLWMRLPLPMALDHVNVYALRDADGWTLIDTGMATGKTRGLWQALLDGPLSGAPVARVLVTHHHPDHLGLAGWFQARGADLLMTRTAWLYGRMLVLDRHEAALPESLLFLRRAGLSAAALAEKAAEKPFNFADVVAPMPLGFTRLVEGQVLVLGGRRWTVRLGSGHAPDHATLWSLDDDLVLGGDQLLPGISPHIGVYATEPEADPLAEWLASCQAFQPLAQDRHLVLPGHKLPYRGLPERLAAMIANHRAGLDRLMALLDRPRRTTEVFPALFKREIGPAEFGMALSESVAHLNHLRATGRAERSLAEDGAWLWRALA